jgi:hypothetical protein
MDRKVSVLSLLTAVCRVIDAYVDNYRRGTTTIGGHSSRTDEAGQRGPASVTLSTESPVRATTE